MIVPFDNDPPMSFTHLYVDTIEDVCGWVDNERLFVVIKYGDEHYYCDQADSYRIRDMSALTDVKDGKYWKPVTGKFDTVEEAFDYPLLDGKSIRERFDEVEFLTD